MWRLVSLDYALGKISLKSVGIFETTTMEASHKQKITVPIADDVEIQRSLPRLASLIKLP